MKSDKPGNHHHILTFAGHVLVSYALPCHSNGKGEHNSRTTYFGYRYKPPLLDINM
jgi:hypothetical protein